MNPNRISSRSIRAGLAIGAVLVLANVIGCAADQDNGQPAVVRERRPEPITGSNVPRSSTGPVQSASGILKP